MRIVVVFGLMAAVWGVSTTSSGVFLDGTGHYGLLGELRSRPVFKGKRYQAVRQSFSLLGEARHHDRLSLFLELRLFPNPRAAFLGDQVQPQRCARRYDKDGALLPPGDCRGEHQDISAPAYEQLLPRITQAYVRYSFEYCLLEVGRRGRDWGLGMFLDSGRQPFATQQSVFDGVTCHVNVLKNQVLGFSFGYDKLAETGTYIALPEHFPTKQEEPDQQNFGVSSGNDDIHQIFFTIEYDNRESADNSGFSRVTGGYFSSIFAKNSDISVKFFDLYMALFYKGLSAQTEFLFRLGNSSDPSWHLLGGKRGDIGQEARNKLNAIAVAGNFAWEFYKSGTAVDKTQSRQRPQQRHTLLFDYVITPGDADGYYRDLSVQEEKNEEVRQKLAVSNRDGDVGALALHQNFNPALIFFNGAHADHADLRVEGVFDPYQLVNVYLFALGYRYENFIWGDVELKLVTGQLQKGINKAAKEYYKDKEIRPIGYHGKDLGYELDVKYSYHLDQELELGLAAAVAMPGKAWKTSDAAQKQNFLLQTSVAFKF